MRVRIELLGHVLRIEPVPRSSGPEEDAAPYEWIAASHRQGLSEPGGRFAGDGSHEEQRWRSPDWVLAITGGGVLAVTLTQVLGAGASKPVEILSALFGMTGAALILRLMRRKSRK